MNALYQWFVDLYPVWQALIATFFTWGVTALGSALVFLFTRIKQTSLDAMMGFAAGVMLAASYWSLLAPAIEMSQDLDHLPIWFPALTGFLAGGIFLSITDKILPHLHPNFSMSQAEGIPTRWKRKVLLVLAITLHNIPEGLAIGVAFGSLTHGLDSSSIGGAIALSIGIGLQNFPEGAAVSLPLRRDGMSQTSAFFWGQLSAVVEPIAAVTGAVLVMSMQAILPYALSFAAGAMVFVVMEELIPEAHRHGNADLVSYATLIGFAIMMTLDVALG